MRWFKHLSNASDDALISKIQNRFGLDGYARFFKLVEGIAASMKRGGEPTLALPWQRSGRLGMRLKQ